MSYKLYSGDCLEVLRALPDESVHCCVTSPPYWGLRDYGCDGQLGLESTPEEYVANIVEVFREVKRVLRKDGTLWLNLGDSYCGTGNKGEYKDPKYTNGRNGQKVALNNKIDGLKSKDLVGIPWRVAFALQADGWWLRSDIIWAKPNPMPESVTDRPTKAHEYIFLLSKSERYFYDAEAIKEPIAESTKMWGGGKQGWGPSNTKHATPQGTHGPSLRGEGRCGESSDGKRNKRTVWNITTKPYKEAHFATFPPELPEICIKAGCPEGGTVLDPFAGAGTTLFVAEQLGRNSIGIELNPEYCEIIRRRMASIEPSLFD